MQSCPCGTAKFYLDCCGPFISHQKVPATPEELMRSRYTAFTQVNAGYIAATMKSPAADDFDAQELEEWSKSVSWLGLEVIKTGHDSLKGWVEFIAHYAVDGKKTNMHELSEFHCEDGRWYYVDGNSQNKRLKIAKKVGRNEICPCGSQKKYKKCCAR
jgi:SEC-C motif-containing protein